MISSLGPLAAGQSILSSKHNLSASGPGDVRALGEERVCLFCHTPHGSRDVAPLWNRDDSTVSYLPYDSPTLAATVGQPTGASKLCLSCHDGTIALGELVSEDQSIAMNGGDFMPAGPGLIGTDLSDDHPISFDYFETLAAKPAEYTSPASWPSQMRLDDNNELQCTTCHDPHDDAWGQFLVMDNQGAALCQQCHAVAGFDESPHALSTAQWDGSGLDPWPHTTFADVQSNGCMNCHRSHDAGAGSELMTYAREEDTCFACHDGSLGTKNLKATFEKYSIHPVAESQGVHEAGESALAAAGHVECSDCHNPHRARATAAVAPAIPGAMEGVTGVDATGAPLDEAIYEYQVCFKCHGASAPPPMASVPREIQTFDTLKEFNPASPSYHPVEATGKGADVPSLIAPLDTASMIYCSDCHGNDGATGGGPAGPHGSDFEFLLGREYRTGEDVVESPTAYALCYQCHSRASILDAESFSGHAKHVVDQQTSCATCHDPHGIDFGQGNATNNAHLINFDVEVVDPDPVSGLLEYRATGFRSGECYLSCHGVAHSPKVY